jgi:hypothetical protein
MVFCTPAGTAQNEFRRRHAPVCRQPRLGGRRAHSAVAFTLCATFIHGHSKLFRRYPMSTIEVARQLRLSVSKLAPNIQAPDAPAALSVS